MAQLGGKVNVMKDNSNCNSKNIQSPKFYLT
jgi:hypothetical protein